MSTAKKTTAKAAPKAAPAPAEKSLILTPTQADIASASFTPGTQAGMTAEQATGSWDTEAMRVKATAAADIHLLQMAEDERHAIGTFVDLPFGTENWHHIRCGRKSSDRAVAMARRLYRSGFVQCAPQVRLKGFENEGSDGLYVCCPPGVHEKRRIMKVRLQKARHQNLSQTFDSALVGHMGNMTGVDVRAFDLDR